MLNGAAVLLAFEQVGGADAHLEMARDYALERYAFGRADRLVPGIKHKLADVYVAHRAGALQRLLRRLGARHATRRSCRVAAAAARIAATEAFYFAAKENIQMHGGMGFTWEIDCHLYYRRAELLALVARQHARLEGPAGHAELETASAA